MHNQRIVIVLIDPPAHSEEAAEDLLPLLEKANWTLLVCYDAAEALSAIQTVGFDELLDLRRRTGLGRRVAIRKTDNTPLSSLSRGRRISFLPGAQAEIRRSTGLTCSSRQTDPGYPDFC